MTIDGQTNAFLRAWAAGTLAGGGPVMLMTVPMGVWSIAGGHVFSGLFLAVLPLLIAGAATLTAMVVIGLPITALLHSKKKECPRIYGLAGAIFGFIIPPIVLVTFENADEVFSTASAIFCIFGALAGTVTAVIWGRFRKEMNSTTNPYAAEEAQPNPIHDLIY